LEEVFQSEHQLLNHFGGKDAMRQSVLRQLNFSSFLHLFLFSTQDYKVLKTKMDIYSAHIKKINLGKIIVVNSV